MPVLGITCRWRIVIDHLAMAADQATTTGLGKGQFDGNIPLTEVPLAALDQFVLVGAVDAMANRAGAPLDAVDVQPVEIPVAIAESGGRDGEFLLEGRRLMAVEAQSVPITLVDGV